MRAVSMMDCMVSRPITMCFYPKKYFQAKLRQVSAKSAKG
jgi:hypothetical protein